MNQTIVITISGQVFHIEDAAYEALKQYLTAIKNHFASDEDSFEIITDIEARIAELLAKQLKEESRAVVNTSDVAFVVTRLGKISDFEESTNATEPASPTQPRVEKRFMRNPDDRIIGGVCSGAAAYLGLDTVWIRIVFAFLFFFGGSGFLIYCILWAVIPKAITRADKLAMKGKAATIEELKQSLNEELRSIPSGKASSFLRELFDIIGTVAKTLFRVFGKFIGAFIVLFSLGMLVGCIVGALSILNGSLFWEIHNDWFFVHLLPDAEQTWFALSWLLVVFFPALGLLVLGIRLISDQFLINKYTGKALFIAWIICVSISIYQSIGLGMEFKEQGKIRLLDSLTLSPSKTYYLQVQDTGMNSFRFHAQLDEEEDRYDQRQHHLHHRNRGLVNLRLEKNPTGKVELERIYTARGRNTSMAIETAEKIRYSFSQKDSMLVFSENYAVPEGSLFRVQNVDLILRIPEGSKLVVDGAMHDLLDSYWWWDCADFDSEETILVVEGSGINCVKKRRLTEN